MIIVWESIISMKSSANIVNFIEFSVFILY